VWACGRAGVPAGEPEQTVAPIQGKATDTIHIKTTCVVGYFKT